MKHPSFRKLPLLVALLSFAMANAVSAATPEQTAKIVGAAKAFLDTLDATPNAVR